MVDYNFIKRCKNYNIKKSKGFKYETIMKRSMNKIKKLDEKIDDKYFFRCNYLDRRNKIFYDYIYGKISKNEYNKKLYNEYIYGKISENEYEKKIFNLKYFTYKNSEKEYYKNLIKVYNEEKFKMCIHKLKLSLPDHLIYRIGNFL